MADLMTKRKHIVQFIHGEWFGTLGYLAVEIDPWQLKVNSVVLHWTLKISSAKKEKGSR